MLTENGFYIKKHFSYLLYALLLDHGTFPSTQVNLKMTKLMIQNYSVSVTMTKEQVSLEKVTNLYLKNVTIMF